MRPPSSAPRHPGTLNDFVGNVLVLAFTPSEAHSAYADEVPQEAGHIHGGRTAEFDSPIPDPSRGSEVDFDAVALGKRYLVRAAQINPNSEAQAQLASVSSGDRQLRVRQLPKENRYEAASALPDRDRFELFWVAGAEFIFLWTELRRLAHR